MAYEFKFPDVGEGITEGEIVKWLVKEGEDVKEDQNIVQVETDKAVVDLPSPKKGKILKINFKEGENIKVGEALCVIGGAGDKVVVSKKKEIKKEPIKKSVGKKKDSFGVVGELEASGEDYETSEMGQSETMIGSSQTKKVLASPIVRKLAREMKIDLSKIKGSGNGGIILKSDLGVKKKKTIEKPAQQKILVKKKYDEYGYLERIPLKGIRKTIAKNMVISHTETAPVTAMEDIDVSKLWNLRSKEKKILEKKGIDLTFLPFIIKASIAALKENPLLNSSIEGDEIIIKKYFNIGVAVETEVGLMVPVVKIAEDKTIIQLAKEIKELAVKSRSRKIDLMDLKGSTFTITNYGSIGGNYGTPIINPGEAAILGLGRIFDRAILENKKIRNAKILPISLTFDHRILDGAQAARFLESLKLFLEDPANLLMKLK